MDWSRLTLPAGASESGGEIHFPCPVNPDSRKDSAWVVPAGGPHPALQAVVGLPDLPAD